MKMLHKDPELHFNNTLLLFLWSLFIPAFSLLAYFYIIRPYYLVNFYKKQGAIGKYMPVMGFFIARFKDVMEHGDFMYFFKKTVKEHPEARMITSNFGSRPIVYLVDPDLNREFFNIQVQHYEKADYMSDIPRLFIGDGILFAEGESWKNQRRLLSSAFHPEALRDVVPMLNSTTKQMYETLSKGNLSDVNLLQENEKVFGEVLGQFFFGSRASKHTFEGKSLALGINGLMFSGLAEMLNPWTVFFRPHLIKTGLVPRHKQLLRRANEFRETCKTIIADKKKFMEDEKEPTLLQMLMDQQKESTENCMTDNEIIDTFATLTLAGLAKVSDLVTMALFFLSKNPEIREKMMREINEVFGSGEEITMDQIQRMDYTHAVLKETFRRATPAPFLIMRSALDDHKLGNINIKRGTLLTVSPYLNINNPKNVPDEDVFRPERWFSDEGKELNALDISFSAGARMCLGKDLVMIQSKIMLVNFMRKFDMNLVSEENPRMMYTVTYRPLEPVRMNLSVK